MRMTFYPDVYARLDLSIESACLWLEEMRVNQLAYEGVAETLCTNSDIVYIPSLIHPIHTAAQLELPHANCCQQVVQHTVE